MPCELKDRDGIISVHIHKHTDTPYRRKKHIKFTNHIHYTRSKISVNFVYLDFRFFSFALISRIFFLGIRWRCSTLVSNPIKYLHELFISVVNAKWVCFSFIQIEHGLLDYIGVFCHPALCTHSQPCSQLTRNLCRKCWNVTWIPFFCVPVEENRFLIKMFSNLA